jgi:hypothetical protein
VWRKLVQLSGVPGGVVQTTKEGSRGCGKWMLVVHEIGWVAESSIEFWESSQHRIGDAKCVCVLSRCTIYVLFPTEHRHLSQRPLCLSCHSRSLSHSPHRDNQAYERRRRSSRPYRPPQLQLNSHPDFRSNFFRVSIHVSIITNSSRMSWPWLLHTPIAYCV